jgi:hypothetical protein
MRPAATLATAAGALEPHVVADLRPVNRIKPSHLSPDRHRRLLAPVGRLLAERALKIK